MDLVFESVFYERALSFRHAIRFYGDRIEYLDLIVPYAEIESVETAAEWFRMRVKSGRVVEMDVSFHERIPLADAPNAIRWTRGLKGNYTKKAGMPGANFSLEVNQMQDERKYLFLFGRGGKILAIFPIALIARHIQQAIGLMREGNPSIDFDEACRKLEVAPAELMKKAFALQKKLRFWFIAIVAAAIFSPVVFQLCKLVFLFLIR